MEKLLHSFDSKIDIVKMLEYVGEFLKKQTANISQFQSDPTIIGKIASEEKMFIATDVIFQYKQNLELKIQELKQSIASIKVLIRNIIYLF